MSKPLPLSPRHFSQNRSSSFLSWDGFLPSKEDPGTSWFSQRETEDIPKTPRLHAADNSPQTSSARPPSLWIRCMPLILCGFSQIGKERNRLNIGGGRTMSECISDDKLYSETASAVLNDVIIKGFYRFCCVVILWCGVMFCLCWDVLWYVVICWVVLWWLGYNPFHCNVLCCIVLYVLYCIVLCCVVLSLCCIVLLYCVVLYCSVVVYCVVLYCTVLYCVALYCVVLYCVVLCCVVLYCAVLYCVVLL